MSLTEKPLAYDQRRLTSIPAPLECDSDSDFNPGVYKYERELKKQVKRKRRGEPFQVLRRKKKRSSESSSAVKNPLLEYFHDLDLHSASDGEQDESRGSDGEELEEEHEMTEEHSGNEVGSERASASDFAPRTAHLNDERGARHGMVPDDSATESESENDKPIPSVQKKVSEISSDSATESETEGETPETTHVDWKKASLRVPSSSLIEAADSSTEPESECETTDNLSKLVNVRPRFSLSPEQRGLGPLILDHKRGIMVPASINAHLRDYQRDGVRFFWDKYQRGCGGLLGDDMGLGKTIQVIAFLSAIMKKHNDERDLNRRRDYVSQLQDGREWRKTRTLPQADAKWPTVLIIAPSTVVHNWEREFGTWGYFEVGLFMGMRKERETVLRDFKMGRLDIVLTSFDLARRDINILDDLPWSCIIVDEVHHVKNARSKISEAYHQFVCRRRFGLTGTAIQNSYMELWTILDWTNPGQLGEENHWKGYVAKPLTIGQSAGATEDERTKALAVAVILKDKLLPQFFLRRTKDLIKDQLPVKTDEVVFCPLTSTQISVYKRILDMREVQNLIRKDDNCDCGSRKKRKNCCHPFVMGDVFKFMSILIKLSNHLALILPAPTDTAEQTLRNRQLAEIAFPNEPIPKYGSAMLQPQFCGKWTTLETLLKEWRKDPSNKVLIFTKSVKLLEMLEFHLSSRSYGFLKLDGSTKQIDRMPMIDQFHNDPSVFVFLISTLAGGTGLNLTGANKVVIFDPNWNPAHDLQAMDRAYRFGQTRDVSAYRFLGAGSLEELIYARQLYKQQQMAIGYQASVQTRYFEGVQGDTTKQGELFGIKNIFKLHENTLATKMAIEKANLADLDWALANLGGGKPKKQANGDSEEWLREADLKVGKEEGDLRGLGSLLFDDDPPQTPNEDVVQTTLSSIGVKYSHRNDELLLPSRIEEERARTAVLERKRRRAEAKTARTSRPQPQWPPKRKHHKVPMSPQTKLESRQMALIEMGLISCPGQLPVFAQNFARKSREEQNEMLSRLDEHAKKSRG